MWHIAAKRFWLMPVPDAMALHAITQMASNGWRGLLWMAHIRWRIVLAYLVAIGLYLLYRAMTHPPRAKAPKVVEPLGLKLYAVLLLHEADGIPQHGTPDKGGVDKQHGRHADGGQGQGNLSDPATHPALIVRCSRVLPLAIRRCRP